MSNHPLNLLLRFLLEIVCLISVGYWCWQTYEGMYRIIFTLIVPLILALVWSAVRVTNDPGKALIPVSGLVRLIIELVLLASGVVALYITNNHVLSYILAAVILIHYLLSYDRVL